ncbi:MAG: twin-arginine translocation signal domain-containing protein, partial [Odoribacter sp.]|nr:twin-arginine translocation signal domain-containing protein [Odoribacter sp.]
MVSRRDFLKKGGLAMMAAAVSTTPLKAVAQAMSDKKEFVSNRPLPADRHFMSKA